MSRSTFIFDQKKWSAIEGDTETFGLGRSNDKIENQIRLLIIKNQMKYVHGNMNLRVMVEKE